MSRHSKEIIHRQQGLGSVAIVIGLAASMLVSTASSASTKTFTASEFFTASAGGQTVSSASASGTYNSVTSTYLTWTLTSNDAGRAGAVWYKNRLDLSANFEINAEINLGSANAGADGLAFVMQTSSSTSLSQGGGLGFSGIVPAVAVEFDTFPNGTANGDHDSTENDYWGIYKNNSTADGSASTTTAGVVPDGETAKEFSLGDIEDNNWRAVKFTWTASNQTFVANVDNNRDGDFSDAGETLTKTGIDIYGTGKTFGTNPVYWGFTASTGGSTNLQQVRFKNDTPYVATAFVNASPTIQDRTNVGITATGGAQNVDFTISDNSTTQAQWGLSATSSDTAVATVTSSITSATNARVVVTPVAAGQSTITVTLTDADGAQVVETFTVTVANVPGAPTIGTATGKVESVDLTWTAPASNGGSAITGYRIDISSDGGANYTTEVASTGDTDTSATISNLTVGTSYLFKVYAINVIGTSAASAASNAAVAQAVPKYDGPLFTSIPGGGLVVGPSNLIVLGGNGMEKVSDLYIGDQKLTFTRDSAGKLVVQMPKLPAGTYSLRAIFDGGASVTHQDAIVIPATSVAGTTVRRTGDNVAVRVVAANARILLNGVRVASRSSDGPLTRTLTLRAGRNVIQIVVDGTVIRTVRYTR